MVIRANGDMKRISATEDGVRYDTSLGFGRYGGEEVMTIGSCSISHVLDCYWNEDHFLYDVNFLKYDEV